MTKGRLEAFSDGVRALIRAPGQAPGIAEAIGSDFKGKVSPAVYAVAIPIALVLPLVAFALYVLVALLWVVPDRRFDQKATEDGPTG